LSTTRLANLLSALILILPVASAAQGASALGAVQQTCAAVSVETCAIARTLGRGVNMGNMLEAPREGDWGLRVEPAYIDKATAVFNTVRLPVRWSNHAAPTADAKLDEVFAARVDQVVDSLLAKGVYVILNMHHYNQLFGDHPLPNEFAVPPDVVQARFVNLWAQLGRRYKDRSPKLIFELLNEPHGNLNGEPWNLLMAKALTAVRASNPARAVLVGPTEWNSIADLDKLTLPPDRNLIVSIHNYDPFPFTHQGVTTFAKPFPVGATCCDPGQRKAVVDVLDRAVKWSIAKGYPLHLGEFGSYRAADIASRENYTRFVRDELEKRGIGWTYWEFASSFGMYDPKTGNWIEPLRRALLD